MSDSNMTSNGGTNARKSYRPQKGKDQAEREELSLTRSLREGTASAPAAPWCQENRAEAEATPEGEGSKPKRGDNATGANNETAQINGGGHAQDIARKRQQSPPQKRTGQPPRRSEGRNE